MDHLVGDDPLSNAHQRVDIHGKERVKAAPVVSDKVPCSRFLMTYKSDRGGSMVGVVVENSQTTIADKKRFLE